MVQNKADTFSNMVYRLGRSFRYLRISFSELELTTTKGLPQNPRALVCPGPPRLMLDFVTKHHKNATDSLDREIAKKRVKHLTLIVLV